jgi:hypothetical protein
VVIRKLWDIMWKKGVAFGEMWNLKGRKGRKEG